MESEKIKEVSIHINMETAKQAEVEVVKDDRRTNRYTIPVEDLAGVLDASMEREQTVAYECIGAMPTGYLGMSYADNRNFTVACKIAGQVSPYHYMAGGGDRVMLVPFPDTLFLFEVRDGKLKRSKCYAVKGNELLCHYPFPNVYANGNICWGGNTLPEIQCVGDIDQLMLLFIGSGFNTHLYGSEKTTLGFDKIEDLIRYLEKMEQFPDEVLCELPDAQTVAGIVKSIGKGEFLWQ